MTNMISLLLALLMALTPATGANGENASAFDAMWAINEWSFLADWGVLTETEAALLSADTAAVRAGRDLVRRGSVTTGALTGVAEFDETLAALLARASFELRAGRNAVSLTVMADGEVLEHVAVGEQDGALVLGSSLLPGAVGVTAEDLTGSALAIRFVAALRDNGFISADDARAINMLLLTGQPTSFEQVLSLQTWTLEGLDLSAWDVVMADVLGRIAIVEGEDGTRMWSLDVTPEDLWRFMKAGLIVVRDNPELNAQLAEITGFNAANTDGKVSFNDAFITPMLTLMEGAETLPPVHTRLTGCVDAQGRLVSMQIDLCDAEEPEFLPVMLRVAYSRTDNENGETHEILFGDSNRMYIYLTSQHVIGQQGESCAVTLGEFLEDGARSDVMTADLGWRVQRAEVTLKTRAEFWLDIICLEANQTSPYSALKWQLDLDVSEREIAVVMHGDRMIRGNADLHMDYAVRCVLDGVDLAGRETFAVTVGEVELLAYAADIRTEAPAAQAVAGEVTMLGQLSNDELTAWVGNVKVSAEAWYTAQQSGWLGEMIALWDTAQPEEEPEITLVTPDDWQ